MAKQRTPNRFWSQLCQLLLDKALKKKVLKEGLWNNLLHFDRLSYFMCALCSNYFPLHCLVQQDTRNVEAVEEPLQGEEKNKSADISKQKEQCLVPCDAQAKILRGDKHYMCSMYSSRIVLVMSYAVPCYAILSCATLCCANLVFNLLEHT